MRTISFLLCLFAVALAGCRSKAKSQAREREAFFAGQRQGIAQVEEARRINIRVLGPVRQPEVPWQDGLTLIQALAIANYSDPRDPRSITIIRQRERAVVSPRDLLAGKDVPLEPGDTVEILP